LQTGRNGGVQEECEEWPVLRILPTQATVFVEETSQQTKRTFQTGQLNFNDTEIVSILCEFKKQSYTKAKKK